MDVITVALIGQLFAALSLVVMIVLGPPDPRQAVRLRDDGSTERVDEHRGKELWSLLTRGLVALFAFSTLLGITGVLARP